MGQHFLLISTAENVTDFRRKRVFSNRLLSTPLRIFDEPWTQQWSCRWSKEIRSMSSCMIPASVWIYLWTQKNHMYGTAKDHCCYSAVATTSRQNFDWDIPVIVNNVSEVQPSNSVISAAPSNQYFHPASPTHPIRKTSTQKLIVCQVCYITLSGNISRQKFAIRQKCRHSCECGKSIAWKYDLNYHICQVHDNCPFFCGICSQPFSKRQTFVTHKIIKHSANSNKNIGTPCATVHMSANTISRAAHGDHLTGITSKSALLLTDAYNSWYVLSQYGIKQLAKHTYKC